MLYIGKWHSLPLYILLGEGCAATLPPCARVLGTVFNRHSPKGYSMPFGEGYVHNYAECIWGAQRPSPGSLYLGMHIIMLDIGKSGLPGLC